MMKILLSRILWVNILLKIKYTYTNGIENDVLFALTENDTEDTYYK